ncbi:cell-envelope stress modulator CpxP [Serratia sp. NPDC078593]|uniref:cell-envelope stress modulator CpxP n=1 Tax=unclassified Serratia (in: enterobacteria) TaxID=2647522 RepID=UPI0037CE26B4
MRKVAVLVMASTLALVSTAATAADTISEIRPAPKHDAISTPGQHHMFDGVSLTEQQRQQMRDLMHQARNDLPDVNVAEMEAMHKLVTANKFDEAAVHEQAEKMAQEQVKRQIVMARVRNQMYNLLTPQQKSVLDQKHLQRMQQMKQQISGLQQTSAQKLSATE